MTKEQERIKKFLAGQPKKFAFSTIDRTGNNAVTFQGVVYEIPAGKRKLVPAPIADLVRESERSMKSLSPKSKKPLSERQWKKWWANARKDIAREPVQSEEEVWQYRAKLREEVLVRHPELAGLMAAK